MLVTDGATQMYDDVFEKYNWPERKVCLSLSSKPSFPQVFKACRVRLSVEANTRWGVILCRATLRTAVPLTK